MNAEQTWRFDGNKSKITYYAGAIDGDLQR